MLTVKAIDAARPREKLYKISDGHGLYLVIMPSGSKSWRVNYRVDGISKTKVFGLYPGITLSQARILNLEFKAYLRGGLAKAAPTFDEIKREWYKHKLPTLKNAKHRQQIIYRVDNFVSPHIGKTPIDAIKRANLVEIVQCVQVGGIIETAHRVAMHIRQIFDYAVDLGKLESHPASNLSRVLQTPKTKNMNCIPVAESGQLFKDIANYDEPVTRYGLMLLALTFVRTSELRFMRWSEIRDGAFWVIPADRMKLGKPHVVPLAKQTLAVLEALKNINGDYEYVLNSPTRPKHPICENTLLFALYRMGYKGRMTGHGFRALASTVLNEQSPFVRDVIERQLAHKENDDVRAAYHRAEYLDERIKLMGWWAEWVLK